MSGIFDRLTRGLLARNKPDATATAPGPGSKVEAGPGAGPHILSPDAGLDSRVLSAADVPSPTENVSLNPGEVEYDYAPQPEGRTMGSGPGAYDVQEHGEGYRDVDESGESTPAEADAGIPIDDAHSAMAEAGAVDSPLGTADMLGTPIGASTGGIPTENGSLNFGDIKYEYTPQREGTTGSESRAYEVEKVGEGSRDADEADEVAPTEAADSPESLPIHAHRTDTVARDEDAEKTDDGDSGDKDSGEPPTVPGPTGPLNASDASSLDGGGEMEDEEVPLTLMDFKVTEDELPAVIEDTGADLGTEALPDLGELGADEDDAPPVE